MARREVVEVKCDRCSKVETQGKDVKTGDGPEFEGTMFGKKVIYEDLCLRCRDAVGGYFKRIAKEADDQQKVEEPAVELPKKNILGLNVRR